MDLTRLAVDAGQFINRAVQYAGESLGQADKTELDPRLEELLARADITKTWTDKIISQTEVLLQPNLGARLEDRLHEHLDWRVPPRPRAREALGDQMIQTALEMGPNTPYGLALLRCGETQKQLGEAEKKFVQSSNIHFLIPLRSFTEGEYRAIQDERRMLLNKRLDLDIANARLKNAHEADREARNLNANPVEDDYLSQVSYMFSFLRVKWLKMWAQEISQAEMELRICQSLFDRQSEITRQVVERISNTHTSHMQSLTDFVEAQACYFDQCNQHAQELQKELASIPAVLCSNNWQSEVSNAVNQPSTSNHVAKEPIRLTLVSPGPVVVHQLPEFDQDSWTINPPSGTGQITVSPENTQPSDQTNNNNNNNTSFINGHPADSNITVRGPPHRAAAATIIWPSSLTTTASPPSELSGTSNESQRIDAVASEAITTNAAAVEGLTTNSTAAEAQPTNESRELPAINEEDVRESSTDSRFGVL